VELVKKTYKPKEEKVKKLTKYFTELKIVKPGNCDLFTKAKMIIILVMLTGCSSEWHLKKAIQKNPSIIKPSTHTIDTIVIRDSFEFRDTFVTKEIDTLTIQKDGVKTIVYRNRDIIQVRTIVQPDTIRITKTITIPQVEYHERIKVPPMVGAGIGFILLILLLLALFKK
jgi:hypothetical protein